MLKIGHCLMNSVYSFVFLYRPLIIIHDSINVNESNQIAYETDWKE